MSAAAPEIQPARLFHFDRRDLKPKTKESFAFVVELLSVFGREFSKQIKSKIHRNFSDEFVAVESAFCEIQQKLSKGKSIYFSLDFPKTKVVIERFRYEGRSDEHFFNELKRLSLVVLSFPQRALSYPNPDIRSIEAIESSRVAAFQNLFSSKQLTGEEKNAAAGLYFNAGALVANSKVVKYGQLIRIWNKNYAQGLLEKFGCLNVIEENPNRDIKARIEEGISFCDFLINVSVQEIENNLKVTFCPFVRLYFRNLFVDEHIRSDFCYYTSSLSYLYALDFRDLSRASFFHLTSLQIVVFINRTCDVKEEIQEELYKMLMARPADWDFAKFKAFNERKWEVEDLSIQSDEFDRIWSDFERILSMVNDLKPYENPYCWPLFEALFENQKREHVVQLFLKLDCKMGLEEIDRIYRENHEVFNGKNTQFFCEQYIKIIEILKTEKIEFVEKECLFLVPSVKDFDQFAIPFGNAERNIEKLIFFLKEHQFCIEQEHKWMFRQFILHPSLWLLELLKDAPSLGIEKFCDKELEEILSKLHKPLLNNAFKVAVEVKEQALKTAFELQNRFHFPHVELFLLYVETIRLLDKGELSLQENDLGLIEKLQEFCPVLDKKEIFFLLHYHIRVTSEEIDAFIGIRQDWIDHQINRFVVDQEVFMGIFTKISRFSNELAKECEDEDQRERFCVTFERAMHLVFFPPLQPLTDYFLITNITEKEGIRWGEEVWRTHLGQLKPIAKNASNRIYLNWSVFNDHPVLFLSFFDISKASAFSSYIPIGVSAKELEPDENRKPFYSLLGCFARNVLKEEADRSIEDGKKESPDTCVACYDGFEQEIAQYSADLEAENLTIEQIRKIWTFIRKVKLTYRRLHLGIPNGANSDDPTVEAARGHIYPTKEGGSLLPERLLEQEAQPESYLPDPFNQVDSFMELCFQDKGQSGSLDLDLETSVATFPISYLIQTADELTGIDLQNVKHWNERAVPQDIVGGRYVTLSVDGLHIPLRYPQEALDDRELFIKYFHYQNLLLKATVYNRELTKELHPI